MNQSRSPESELKAYREAYVLLADGVIEAIESLKTRLPNPDTNRGQEAVIALVKLHSALNRANEIIVEKAL